MTKRNAGRNDPCPCGSGLKYKKCCLGRRNDPPESGASTNVHDEIRQALGERHFESEEEANAFLIEYTRQRTRQARDDFAGLSPEQMYRLLYHPFDSPDLVSFPETLAEEPDTPILTLFKLLVEAIGEQGLKPTAKGNLPRDFCRDAALAFWGEDLYRHNTRCCGINKEEDFFKLHVTRMVAELAGLIRKYKGRFILSRNCRSLLSRTGFRGVYPRLFLAYVKQFNWGYWDSYPQVFFIQQSFLFTLYLLGRYGNEWRPAGFYEDYFLRAFPVVLDEVEPRPDFTREKMICSCYTSRSLWRFARFLGLAEVEQVEGDKPYEYDYRVKKSPLLDKAVFFHLQG